MVPTADAAMTCLILEASGATVCGPASGVPEVVNGASPVNGGRLWHGDGSRPDFAISAPEIVLAAIASRTGRILLGSAVTVLSTDDSVRVFQRFSTLNALSSGRAEVILGRGSFTESYPLFGYDL